MQPAEWFEVGAEVQVTARLGDGLRVADGTRLTYPRPDLEPERIEEPPTLKITFVPIDYGGIAVADTEIDTNEYLEWTVKRFAIDAIDATVREHLRIEPEGEASLATTYSQALRATDAARLAEAPDRTCYAMMPRIEGIAGGGMALVGTPVAVGSQYQGENLGSGLAAHELGHTFSLLHAACKDSSHADTDYPHPNGTIGVFGRDAFTGQIFPPSWYGVPPAPPDTGDWSAVLLDAAGAELYRARFALQEVMVGDASAWMFAFSVGVPDELLDTAQVLVILDGSEAVVGSTAAP